MATPKLTNWTYQIEQIGAGLYVLRAVDKHGHLMHSVGADLDSLEEDFFEAAQKIDMFENLSKP